MSFNTEMHHFPLRQLSNDYLIQVSAERWQAFLKSVYLYFTMFTVKDLKLEIGIFLYIVTVRISSVDFKSIVHK